MGKGRSERDREGEACSGCFFVSLTVSSWKMSGRFGCEGKTVIAVKL